LPRSSRRTSPSAGFALVEALASLVILAMISALVLAGVSTGRRVWETMDSTAAAAESVEAAQGIVRARVERMFPATRYDASAPYVQMEGRSDALTFLAPIDVPRAPDVLQRYSLALTPAGELTLSSFNDLAAEPDRPAIDTRVLLRGVRTMEVAYFGVAAPDGTPRWRPAWSQQSAPPQLVRIRLTFGDQDRREWPDLIVRPAATVDSLCLLYVARGQCRGRA
jgi:general secretion pathway protein J